MNQPVSADGAEDAHVAPPAPGQAARSDEPPQLHSGEAEGAATAGAEPLPEDAARQTPADGASAAGGDATRFSEGYQPL